MRFCAVSVATRNAPALLAAGSSFLIVVSIEESCLRCSNADCATKAAAMARRTTARATVGMKTMREPELRNSGGNRLAFSASQGQAPASAVA